MEIPMKTMTIRNIPDSVAAGLAESAKATGRSLNATAVAALADAFDHASNKKPKNDFSEFVGTWSEKEYETIKKEIEETFEVIDEDEYKRVLFVAEDPQ